MRLLLLSSRSLSPKALWAPKRSAAALTLVELTALFALRQGRTAAFLWPQTSLSRTVGPFAHALHRQLRVLHPAGA